ncbi:MAG: hypothetical protein AVDCRST_MAG68-305, partial [uncultured Gemmatimonadetes bacterium]
ELPDEQAGRSGGGGRGRTADRRQPPGAEAEGARRAGRGGAQVPHRLLEHRVHRLVRPGRAGVAFQEDPRAGGRAAPGEPQRGPADAVRAHQARHALQHRGHPRGGPFRFL